MKNPDKFYKLEIYIPKDIDSAHAKTKLANSIYEVASLFYETIGEHGKLNDGKKLHGNGHHMAQKIAKLAEELWIERLEDK